MQVNAKRILSSHSDMPLLTRQPAQNKLTNLYKLTFWSYQQPVSTLCSPLPSPRTKPKDEGNKDPHHPVAILPPSPASALQSSKFDLMRQQLFLRGSSVADRTIIHGDDVYKYLSNPVSWHLGSLHSCLPSFLPNTNAKVRLQMGLLFPSSPFLNSAGAILRKLPFLDSSWHLLIFPAGNMANVIKVYQNLNNPLDSSIPFTVNTA